MMKYRLLICFLAISLLCGCSMSADSETESGYRSLSDLLTTERSPENTTEAETPTEAESTEEPSTEEEETSAAGSDDTKTYVDVVPSRTDAADGEESVSSAAHNDSEKNTAAPERVVIYQYVEVPVVPSNYFFSENFSHSDNTLVFSPRELYYNNGQLHATMYIYNGHNTTATDIHDVYLSFDNGTTAIAAASFDRLSGCSIAPDCYVLWEFTFPAEAVYLKSTDLHNINTTYRSTYNY